MTRRVVFVVFPDLQLLDLAGPFEVLASANQLMSGRAGEPSYEVEIVSRGGGVVRSSSGLPVTCDSSIRDCAGAIDTLVVVGGPGSHAASADVELVGWLKEASARSRRTVSVCTGAFVLAATGIFDGLRVTTHWASCAPPLRQAPRAGGRSSADLHPPGTNLDLCRGDGGDGPRPRVGGGGSER